MKKIYLFFFFSLIVFQTKALPPPLKSFYSFWEVNQREISHTDVVRNAAGRLDVIKVMDTEANPFASFVGSIQEQICMPSMDIVRFVRQGCEDWQVTNNLDQFLCDLVSGFMGPELNTDACWCHSEEWIREMMYTFDRNAHRADGAKIDEWPSLDEWTAMEKSLYDDARRAGFSGEDLKTSFHDVVRWIQWRESQIMRGSPELINNSLREFCYGVCSTRSEGTFNSMGRCFEERWIFCSDPSWNPAVNPGRDMAEAIRSFMGQENMFHFDPLQECLQSSFYGAQKARGLGRIFLETRTQTANFIATYAPAQQDIVKLRNSVIGHMEGFEETCNQLGGSNTFSSIIHVSHSSIQFKGWNDRAPFSAFQMMMNRPNPVNAGQPGNFDPMVNTTIDQINEIDGIVDGCKKQFWNLGNICGSEGHMMFGQFTDSEIAQLLIDSDIRMFHVMPMLNSAGAGYAFSEVYAVRMITQNVVSKMGYGQKNSLEALIRNIDKNPLKEGERLGAFTDDQLAEGYSRILFQRWNRHIVRMQIDEKDPVFWSDDLMQNMFESASDEVKAQRMQAFQNDLNNGYITQQDYDKITREFLQRQRRLDAKRAGNQPGGAGGTGGNNIPGAQQPPQQRPPNGQSFGDQPDANSNALGGGGQSGPNRPPNPNPDPPGARQVVDLDYGDEYSWNTQEGDFDFMGGATRNQFIPNNTRPPGTINTENAATPNSTVPINQTTQTNVVGQMNQTLNPDGTTIVRPIENTQNLIDQTSQPPTGNPGDNNVVNPNARPAPNGNMAPNANNAGKSSFNSGLKGQNPAKTVNPGKSQLPQTNPGRSGNRGLDEPLLPEDSQKPPVDLGGQPSNPPPNRTENPNVGSQAPSESPGGGAGGGGVSRTGGATAEELELIREDAEIAASTCRCGGILDFLCSAYGFFFDFVIVTVVVMLLVFLIDCGSDGMPFYPHASSDAANFVYAMNGVCSAIKNPDGPKPYKLHYTLDSVNMNTRGQGDIVYMLKPDSAGPNDAIADTCITFLGMCGVDNYGTTEMLYDMANLHDLNNPYVVKGDTLFYARYPYWRGFKTKNNISAIDSVLNKQMYHKFVTEDEAFYHFTDTIDSVAYDERGVTKKGQDALNNFIYWHYDCFANMKSTLSDFKPIGVEDYDAALTGDPGGIGDYNPMKHNYESLDSWNVTIWAQYQYYYEECLGDRWKQGRMEYYKSADDAGIPTELEFQLLGGVTAENENFTDPSWATKEGITQPCSKYVQGCCALQEDVEIIDITGDNDTDRKYIHPNHKHNMERYGGSSWAMNPSWQVIETFPVCYISLGIGGTYSLGNTGDNNWVYQLKDTVLDNWGNGKNVYYPCQLIRLDTTGSVGSQMDRVAIFFDKPVPAAKDVHSKSILGNHIIADSLRNINKNVPDFQWHLIDSWLPAEQNHDYTYITSTITDWMSRGKIFGIDYTKPDPNLNKFWFIYGTNGASINNAYFYHPTEKFLQNEQNYETMKVKVWVEPDTIHEYLIKNFVYDSIPGDTVCTGYRQALSLYMQPQGMLKDSFSYHIPADTLYPMIGDSTVYYTIPDSTYTYRYIDKYKIKTWTIGELRPDTTDTIDRVLDIDLRFDFVKVGGDPPIPDNISEEDQQKDYRNGRTYLDIIKPNPFRKVDASYIYFHKKKNISTEIYTYPLFYTYDYSVHGSITWKDSTNNIIKSEISSSGLDLYNNNHNIYIYENTKDSIDSCVVRDIFNLPINNDREKYSKQTNKATKFSKNNKKTKRNSKCAEPPIIAIDKCESVTMGRKRVKK